MSADMDRRALHPAGNREIPVAVSYLMAVRAGDLPVTRGQCDLDAVLKTNTLYRGSTGAAELHGKLAIRSRCYSVTGRASTGLPVPRLSHLAASICLDALAVL